MIFWIIDKINNFDGGKARWLIDSFPDYPVYAAVLYLVMVFYLPDYLAKHKKVYNLKYPVAAWNLFLSISSTFGAYHTVSLVYELVFKYQGFYATTCVMAHTPTNSNLTSFTRRLRATDIEKMDMVGTMNKYHASSIDVWNRFYVGPRAFSFAFFTYLKTPELLDTLFLILQGKPVVFLHWFHHMSTAMHSWHSGYVLPPYAMFFVALNYTVHSLMYCYYAFVTLGYRKYVRWAAPFITLLQISQMYVGVGVTGFAYLHYWLGPLHKGELFYNFFNAIFSTIHFAKAQLGSVLLSPSHSFLPLKEVTPFNMADHFYGCDTDATNLRVSVMMYGAYCVLFVKLFRELYLNKTVNDNSLVVKRKRVNKAEADEQQQQQQIANADKQNNFVDGVLENNAGK